MGITKPILIVLESKKTFYYLVSLWLVNIIFSYYVLPPADDVGSYFGAALGFLHKHKVGLLVADRFELMFAAFPGYMFFHGLFLHVLSFFHIPIDHYTYRLFQMFSVIALIIMSCLLLRVIHKRSRKDYMFHSNSFMIVLAITPFSQFCWAVRPEVLGLLFVITSLVCYSYSGRTHKYSGLLYYLSALFIGLALTVHPNFVIISGVIVLTIMVLDIINKKYLMFFSFSLTFLIPLFVLTWWYLMHYPESIQELLNGVKHRSGGGSTFGAGVVRLIKESTLMGGWESIQIRVFYAIFWLPLTIMTTIAAVFAVRNFTSTIKKDRFHILLVALLIAAIIHLISNGSATATYFIITSFIIAFFFPIVLLHNKPFLNGSDINSRKLYKSLVVITIAIILSLHSLIHTIKFAYATKQYYYAPSTHNSVYNALETGDTLFIVTSRFYPLFARSIDLQYREESNVEVHYLVPGIIHQDRIAKIHKSIINKLNDVSHGTTVWAFSKAHITVFDKAQMKLEACVGHFVGDVLCLNFEINEIIYEDKDNLIVRPSLVTIL